ncbi:MAG: signal peptidase I, partial [Pseudomonadota bacterium]
MNFDFSALLVFLSFASGSIWLGHYLIVGRHEAVTESDGETTETPKLPLLVDYSKSFFPIFFIVLILRSFVFEPFKIPSASMMPTLLIGDFILVNKYEYGLRLPVLHDKIVKNKTPNRGDIVV